MCTSPFINGNSCRMILGLVSPYLFTGLAWLHVWDVGWVGSQAITAWGVGPHDPATVASCKWLTVPMVFSYLTILTPLHYWCVGQTHTHMYYIHVQTRIHSYMYTYICAYPHTCTSIDTHTYTHMHIYIHMLTDIYTLTHTYTHMHTHNITHTHTHTHIRTCT